MCKLHPMHHFYHTEFSSPHHNHWHRTENRNEMNSRQENSRHAAKEKPSFEGQNAREKLQKHHFFSIQFLRHWALNKFKQQAPLTGGTFSKAPKTSWLTQHAIHQHFNPLFSWDSVKYYSNENLTSFSETRNGIDACRHTIEIYGWVNSCRCFLNPFIIPLLYLNWTRAPGKIHWL